MLHRVMRRAAVSLCLLAGIGVSVGMASREVRQERSDLDVIYARYSGLARLLDGSYPRTPNGYGILLRRLP